MKRSRLNMNLCASQIVFARVASLAHHPHSVVRQHPPRAANDIAPEKAWHTKWYDNFSEMEVEMHSIGGVAWRSLRRILGRICTHVSKQNPSVPYTEREKIAEN